MLVAIACSSTNDRSAGSTVPSEPPLLDFTPAEPFDVGANDEWFATGFLDFPGAFVEDDHRYDAGFSMYVAAWPFQQTYPGPDYQVGLPSTWLAPANTGALGDGNYSTIEGGLGWWTHNRFGTETPKFVMGGVAREFSEWANGPGAGGGSAGVDRRDWDTPQGKYGVAQLSPNVLWAPDGLNLAPGTNGELFGYGYHPLPILDAQAETRGDTRGEPITTGDNSWTLFLNTANFRGPVSFFVPNFFSKPALDDPSVEGAFFDTSASAWSRYVGMETPIFPITHAVADGVSYARIAPTQFPASDDESSVIVHHVTAYDGAALGDPVAEWWRNGGDPPHDFDPDAALLSEFDRIDDADGSTYRFVREGMPEHEEYPIDWDALVDIDLSDPHTFRYRWNLDLVDREGDSFVLPEYFQLERGANGPIWRPIADDRVPAATGLADHVFPPLGEPTDEPYTTPADPASLWMSPGPTAGPFEAELGDGSTVTYHWYRFVDQPSIRYWNFDDEQLTAMQRRVEDLHRHWNGDVSPIADPTVGELASLDPAIVVEPPAGLEVGYVPIVTRQERTAP